MGKNIYIGDIHGRDIWKEIVEEEWQTLQNEHKIVKDRKGTLLL